MGDMLVHIAGRRLKYKVRRKPRGKGVVCALVTWLGVRNLRSRVRKEMGVQVLELASVLWC